MYFEWLPKEIKRNVIMSYLDDISLIIFRHVLLCKKLPESITGNTVLEIFKYSSNFIKYCYKLGWIDEFSILEYSNNNFIKQNYFYKHIYQIYCTPKIFVDLVSKRFLLSENELYRYSLFDSIWIKSSRRSLYDFIRP